MGVDTKKNQKMNNKKIPPSNFFPQKIQKKNVRVVPVPPTFEPCPCAPRPTCDPQMFFWDKKLQKSFTHKKTSLPKGLPHPTT